MSHLDNVVSRSRQALALEKQLFDAGQAGQPAEDTEDSRP